VFVGSQAGFYEISVGAEKTSFAASFLDSDETQIAPQPSLTVDGQPAGELAGFTPGIRRELWIYLLLAAVLLTALEWATYHRRLTV
jgi:hypothetical protein